jgi:hypothetical protein
MSSKNLKFDLYKSKYLKYKAKYLSLKKMFGGGEEEVQNFIEYCIDNDIDLLVNHRYNFNEFQNNVTNQFIHTMIRNCDEKIKNKGTNDILKKNINTLQMLIRNTGIHNRGIQIIDAPKNNFGKNLMFPKFSINKVQDTDLFRSWKAEEFIARYFPCISCGCQLVRTGGNIPWNDCQCSNMSCFGVRTGDQYEVKNLTLTKEKPDLENVLDFPGGNFKVWETDKAKVILIFVISELCLPFDSNQNTYQITNVLVANKNHLKDNSIIEISSWNKENPSDLNNENKSRVHVKDVNKLDIYEWDASNNKCTPPQRVLNPHNPVFVPAISVHAPPPIIPNATPVVQGKSGHTPAPPTIIPNATPVVQGKSGHTPAPPPPAPPPPAPPPPPEPTYNDGYRAGQRASTSGRRNLYNNPHENPTNYIRGYQDGFLYGINNRKLP